MVAKISHLPLFQVKRPSTPFLPHTSVPGEPSSLKRWRKELFLPSLSSLPLFWPLSHVLNPLQVSDTPPPFPLFKWPLPTAALSPLYYIVVRGGCHACVHRPPHSFRAFKKRAGRGGSRPLLFPLPDTKRAKNSPPHKTQPTAIGKCALLSLYTNAPL